MPKLPHIFLIMADQHRGDCLGCTGNSIIQTPHFDSIAQDGVVFTNAFTSTPSCTPARAGLLTGMSPWNHGMLGYAFVARKYKYEMPQMLRDAGYYTCGIGKMHWHPQRSLHGFHETHLDESGRVEDKNFISDYRRWFQKVAPEQDPDTTGIGWNSNKFGEYALDEKLHPTYWTGEMVVKKIEEHDIENPLFLKVSFARPHSPYDAPKRFADMYSWEDMPEPHIGDWCEKNRKNIKRANPSHGDFGALNLEVCTMIL
ncbi:MAG: sulfatase-like hydrolase/transferase [Promethearchaeota archaeon]